MKLKSSDCKISGNRYTTLPGWELGVLLDMEYLTESRSDVAVDRSVVARDEISPRREKNNSAANSVRFNHLDVIDNIEKSPRVKQKDLVNRINYILQKVISTFIWSTRRARAVF